VRRRSLAHLGTTSAPPFVSAAERLRGQRRTSARATGVVGVSASRAEEPSCHALPARMASTNRGGLAIALVLLLALPRVAHAQAVPDPDPWWGPDKALHFGLSAAISGAAYGFTGAFDERRPVRLAVGAGVGLLAGATKELLDLAGLGHPSWKDFTLDVIGTACGVLVAFLLDVFVFTPLLKPAPVPQPG
jgi:putative lipoprotein